MPMLSYLLGLVQQGKAQVEVGPLGQLKIHILEEEVVEVSRQNEGLSEGEWVEKILITLPVKTRNLSDVLVKNMIREAVSEALTTDRVTESLRELGVDVSGTQVSLICESSFVKGSERR